MDSWWQLGEWSGVSGEELALYNITCPFCIGILRDRPRNEQFGSVGARV